MQSDYNILMFINGLAGHLGWADKLISGNCCPRGSFYHHVLAKLSPQKQIPKFVSQPGFRLFMVVLIMTVFSVQMGKAWGDFAAMGMVFGVTG
jgi:hypothetical protein